MNQPLVSIIIPVYGVEKFIQKCAESVFNQTYSNLEIIFVNDCTNDNSIGLVEKVLKEDKFIHRSSQTKIINHKVNRGLATTRNTGLENSLGDYIFHLDGDDYLEDFAINKLVLNVIKESSDIVFTNLQSINEDNEIIKVHTLKKNRNKNKYLESVVLRSTGLNVCGNLYKKSLFSDIKFIDNINFGEDYATLPRLLYKADRISFIEVSIYNYVKSNESSYTSNINQRSIDDLNSAFEVLLKFFMETGDIKLIKMINMSFYRLKSHIIKTTRGKYDLLMYYNRLINNQQKRYPIRNGLSNNLINLLFDINLKIVSIVIQAIR